MIKLPRVGHWWLVLPGVHNVMWKLKAQPWSPSLVLGWGGLRGAENPLQLPVSPLRGRCAHLLVTTPGGPSGGATQRIQRQKLSE